jgi:UDP-glucose 4-epimerase
VIKCAETVTGKKVAYDVAPRRAGDPPRLVGDSSRAQKILGWKQGFGDLKTIVETAWRWHQGHPGGYPKG